MAKPSSKILAIGIVVIAVAGLIFVLQRGTSPQKQLLPPGEQTQETTENETVIDIKDVDASFVWNCDSAGCLSQWHACQTSDCFVNLMKQFGASDNAINFSNLLERRGERGYLMEFQEKGRVDLGLTAFPNRANTNTEFVMLNGDPLIVPTGLTQEEVANIMESAKQDILYEQMIQKYPQIYLLNLAPGFVQNELLASQGQRFIFKYQFVNNCRICNTIYFALISFDFDANGKFLGKTFMNIDP